MAGYEFWIDVSDRQPFSHKPIVYPDKARRFLCDHLASLERLGVVRRVDTLREPPPTFTCNVVLVPEGQTGQAFRACSNVVDVNHRSRRRVYPIGDCQQALDRIG